LDALSIQTWWGGLRIKNIAAAFFFSVLPANDPAFRLAYGALQIFEMAKTQLAFGTLAGAVCFTPFYLFNIFITAYNHGYAIKGLSSSTRSTD
jgi:hypothetical protein